MVIDDFINFFIVLDFNLYFFDIFVIEVIDVGLVFVWLWMRIVFMFMVIICDDYFDVIIGF